MYSEIIQVFLFKVKVIELIQRGDGSVKQLNNSIVFVAFKVMCAQLEYHTLDNLSELHAETVLMSTDSALLMNNS